MTTLDEVVKRIDELEDRVEDIEDFIKNEVKGALDTNKFFQKLVIILLMALLSLAGLKELIPMLFP